MKNIIIALAMLMPLMTLSQSDHFDQRNAIRTSPIEFGKAEFQLGYEYYFAERNSSVVIMPSIILKDSPQELKEGFAMEAQMRFYLSHLKSENQKVFLGFHNIGLYTGLYGKYINYKSEYDFSWWDDEKGESYTEKFEKKVDAGEGGILIGVQIDITKRILCDFFVGGGIRYPKLTDTKDGVVDPNNYYYDVSVFDIDYKGVKPKVGFQLGFMF